MLGIVVSHADSASTHIGDHLLDLRDWTETSDETRPPAEGGGTVYRLDGVELRTFERLHLRLDGVADVFDDPDLLVFASRHAGETGKLLTAHHTGNFGPAEHGGDSNALARACPNAHSRVLDALREHAPEGYDVGMECTHHGPSDVGVPSMFVELGSAEPQWEDPDAARAVANAILDLRDADPDRPVEDSGDGATRRHIVGFGGGHYTPRFERIVRETEWAVGHVAADWGLDAMGDPEANRAVLRDAIEASSADYAVVDGDRPTLEAVVSDLGCRVVGETWVRAVAGVPLTLVDRLESVLQPVSAGLRFGTAATEVTPDVSVETIEFPAELLAEVQGIDRERTRTLVAETALAFETREGGTRVGDRGAFLSRGDYDTLLDGFLDVLRMAYDDVERREDELVVRTTRFDPSKAASLGVPEGPAYGRLADGEAVEVDGSTIPPDVVRTEEVHRFPV
jgi:D-aminoacyl-tRNA deacylase